MEQLRDTSEDKPYTKLEEKDVLWLEGSTVQLLSAALKASAGAVS